jgi:hypothetical protein
MKRVIVSFIAILWLSVVFGQLPKATVQPQRGFSFNFSNEQLKNFPQVVYVWPLSDAERAGLKSGMVIAKVNDTWFAKMSQEKITEFLTNLSSQSLVFSFLSDSKSSELTHAPRDIRFNAFLPPVHPTHPDGTCISGNCMDGEGYLRFANRDYFRGIFKDGKPVEGEFYISATASRKKIPEVIDTTYKDYLADITTVNGVGGYKFKRLYPSDKSAKPDIYFESGRKYRGELKGLVPHGKGEVHYSNNKIIDPIPNQSVMGIMILEGEFDNGTFVKATRLRTDAFSGMFIDGGISAGLRNRVPYWQAYNPSLKAWGYRDLQNNYVSEERTVFKPKEGSFCIDGKFNGPGTWYCSQYSYSPIYGGEIHVFKMQEGFVQDSVELVLPHLNYRKKFSVARAPRMYLRLDLLEDYIEIYYKTGKVPEGNWNTAMGNFVVKPPPPPPKTYTISDVLKQAAEKYKVTIRQQVDKNAKILAEGAVNSTDFLTTGLTFGEYLDFGEVMAYYVITLKNAAVEVSGPSGNCPPQIVTAKEAPIQIQAYDCVYLQEQQYRNFFAFKTKFNQPNTEVYYLLYKIDSKK